jgi:succinate dehydrogenase hydrophobic anchor subunit
MNSYFRRVLAAVLVFLALISVTFCVKCVFAEVDQSSLKVAEAENAVDLAFSAVLGAEHAGANVTDLLARLNYAGELLAQAEIAVRKEDSSAGAKADGTVSIANEVEAAAVAAEKEALDDALNGFWSSVAFSVVGVVVFVLALFLVWSRFRRRYHGGLLEAKPEVKGD